MGEAESTLFPLGFNRSVRVETRPERLSGDAGALVLREVWTRLGLDRYFDQKLRDPRSPSLIVHPQSELLRTAALLFAQGFQDQDDVDWLRDDPVLRLAVSDRRGTAPLQKPTESERAPDGLASQPTLSRLVRALSSERQRQALREGLFQAAARRQGASRAHRLRYATLDLDSLPVEVHGAQEGSQYNGHYRERCYHPLVAVVAETGDLLDVQLREGNVHTAKGALGFLLPLLDRMEREYCQVASVRMDAGFPEEKLLTALEQRQVGYVARVRSNARLCKLAAPYLAAWKPGLDLDEVRVEVGELSYQAGTWSRARRVVLVIQQEPGELFPHSFFLITNWSTDQQPALALLDLYRQRGTAEARLGELMNALEPLLSSTRREKSHYRGEIPKRRYAPGDPFAANEVKLLLVALAYNLVHAVRTLLETATGEGWSLQRVIERVLKVPARVLLHARRVTVILLPAAMAAWTALARALRGWRWRPPPQPA